MTATKQKLVQFDSWEQVRAAAQDYTPLWYHAPLDVEPRMVTVLRVFKNGGIRLSGGGFTFTADAGHLSRFRTAEVKP